MTVAEITNLMLLVHSLSAAEVEGGVGTVKSSERAHGEKKTGMKDKRVSNENPATLESTRFEIKHPTTEDAQGQVIGGQK